MKRAFVTGANGFVGYYLTKELLEHGYEVFGGTRSKSPSFHAGVQVVNINLGNKSEIMNILERIQPTVLFHLSGQSSVKKSWEHIQETFEANLMETIELLEAVRFSSLKDTMRMITVGSSEEYGFVNEQPIAETALLNPNNPYGLSKLSMGKVAILYHQLYGMRVIHVRPFNHIGPGQSLGFVTSDFAKQIADIEKRIIEPVILVGELTSKRDFTDVRDIVQAYRMLGERGEEGEVYNVCSGKCEAIQSILENFLSFSSINIKVNLAENKMRPNNIKEYYGCNFKVNKATGWSPHIPLTQSLRDIYEYWLNKS